MTIAGWMWEEVGLPAGDRGLIGWASRSPTCLHGAGYVYGYEQENLVGFKHACEIPEMVFS